MNVRLDIITFLALLMLPMSLVQAKRPPQSSYLFFTPGSSGKMRIRYHDSHKLQGQLSLGAGLFIQPHLALESEFEYGRNALKTNWNIKFGGALFLGKGTKGLFVKEKFSIGEGRYPFQRYKIYRFITDLGWSFKIIPHLFWFPHLSYHYSFRGLPATTHTHHLSDRESWHQVDLNIISILFAF